MLLNNMENMDGEKKKMFFFVQFIYKMGFTYRSQKLYHNRFFLLYKYPSNTLF